jgi:hypothetical protein
VLRTSEAQFTDPWFLQMEQSTPAGRFVHRFSWKVSEPPTAEAIDCFRSRIYCHAILAMLPDQVMPEVLSQLTAIWDEASFSVPIIEAPVTRRFRARVGKRFERPTFPIEE